MASADYCMSGRKLFGTLRTLFSGAKQGALLYSILINKGINPLCSALTRETANE
ncbi:hypothetical protein [Xenorhabdus szentirmaii]|uniref:hypothetical protein n=1 Tax=Xenorhabdus szentirmaii TaxID=290112 RepID=UPI0004BAB5D9|nr:MULTISPECIES: hypothetical protein [Xenorhabdus]MBD2782043.1 hypothetical protein [Xenorhabdus sp. 38]